MALKHSAARSSVPLRGDPTLLTRTVVPYKDKNRPSRVPRPPRLQPASRVSPASHLVCMLTRVEPVAAPPTPTPADIPTPVILADLPCGVCSYNVVGLHQDAPCPECGFPVRFTSSRQHFLGLPRNWTNSVRRGAALVLLAHSMRAAALVTGLIALSLIMSKLGQYDTSLYAVAAAIIFACAHVVSTAGWWLITRPAPSQLSLPLLARFSQRVIRASGAALVVLILVWITLPVINPFAPNAHAMVTNLSLAIVLGGTIAHVAATLVWLHAVSAPLSSLKLRRRSRSYWVVGVLATLLLGPVLGFGVLISWISHVELVLELFKAASHAVRAIDHSQVEASS